MKITCLRGFASSGKSTRAAEIAKDTGAVIVNRDQIRKMLFNEWWTGKKLDEDLVTLVEDSQVTALLRAGTSVVSDNTHINPSYLRRWARLATRLGCEFEVVDIRNDVDWCISADLGRQCNGERHVGPKVIHDQARRWPMHKWPTITAQPFVIEPVEYIPGLPSAIIVDIDGTLAHMTGRSPYDYTRVDEDDDDVDIANIVRDWHESDSHTSLGKVFIVSGRDSSCRDLTIQWLDRKWIYYDQLIMRPADAKDNHGNKLPDYQVKYALFNEHVRGKYNVRFVLDDRQQVVDMWRQLGLKCLQVQPGEF